MPAIKLEAVMQSIMNSVIKARTTADHYSRDLAAKYRQGSKELGTAGLDMPVPMINIPEVDVKLKFAVDGVEHAKRYAGINIYKEHLIKSIREEIVNFLMPKLESNSHYIDINRSTVESFVSNYIRYEDLKIIQDPISGHSDLTNKPANHDADQENENISVRERFLCTLNDNISDSVDTPVSTREDIADVAAKWVRDTMDIDKPNWNKRLSVTDIDKPAQTIASQGYKNRLFFDHQGALFGRYSGFTSTSYGNDDLIKSLFVPENAKDWIGVHRGSQEYNDLKNMKSFNKVRISNNICVDSTSTRFAVFNLDQSNTHLIIHDSDYDYPLSCNLGVTLKSCSFSRKDKNKMAALCEESGKKSLRVYDIEEVEESLGEGKQSRVSISINELSSYELDNNNFPFDIDWGIDGEHIITLNSKSLDLYSFTADEDVDKINYIKRMVRATPYTWHKFFRIAYLYNCIDGGVVLYDKAKGVIKKYDYDQQSAIPVKEVSMASPYTGIYPFCASSYDGLSFAIVNNKRCTVYSSDTLEVIHELEFTDELSQIVFSPHGDILVNTWSPAHPNNLQGGSSIRHVFPIGEHKKILSQINKFSEQPTDDKPSILENIVRNHLVKQGGINGKDIYDMNILINQDDIATNSDLIELSFKLQLDSAVSISNDDEHSLVPA